MVEWDSLSDQPSHMWGQSKFKRDIRKQHRGELIISALTILLIYPLALLRYAFGFRRQKNFSLEHFFGMGVNLDKEPGLTPELLKELGVKDLLIRIHMNQTDRLDEYEAFVRSCENTDIMFVLIPSRQHIVESVKLEKDLDAIFSRFGRYGKRFQVANAINRIKWGFILPNEYLSFFQNVQRVRDARYPGIELIGPSVIDFEYHVTIRALFNFFKLRYDAISSLLYVDRRGAPENRQFIFDLIGKIKLLMAIVALSPKKKSNTIYITETNYPIKGTGKYAPTSDFERVDEEAYSAYMVRYYLLAISTTLVKTVYWHQLIAPGYGLIDNREGIVKRGAFFAYRFMNSLLSDARFVNYSFRDGIYCVTCKTETKTIKALWCNGVQKNLPVPSTAKCYMMSGEEIKSPKQLRISDAVTYVIEENNA